MKDSFSFDFSGGDDYVFTLNFPQTLVSPREIIRERVFSEVAEHNEKSSDVFRGLVQPVGAERILNGFKMKERKKIDPQEQYRNAVEAFERNGFVMLVDDIQIETLDEQIEIEENMEVTFLKLVPLVGG
ncbi:MAG: hypothetical protein JNL64_14565 [Blastocatellia bacterium]|nr:hypothetical protein [Blastocatellia bacterium]